MKKINNQLYYFFNNKKIISGFQLIIFLIFSLALNAQDSENKPEKSRSRLSLSTTQFPNDSIELTALLRAKIDGVYQKISEAEIEFIAVGAEEDKELGKGVTNNLGTASIMLSANSIEKDEEGYMNFNASFAGNDELKADDADASVLRAKLEISPEKEDSLLYINVKVYSTVNDSTSLLEDADVAVFVKRMIGRLKVGEETTGADGEVQIEFPNDLPGDDQGNLLISAFIEDFDEYGNLSANSVQPWGIPVSYVVEELPRTLWSPNPPIWMVLTFFVLMLAVWGHYILIVSKLFKLRKIGEQK